MIYLEQIITGIRRKTNFPKCNLDCQDLKGLWKGICLPCTWDSLRKTEKYITTVSIDIWLLLGFGKILITASLISNTDIFFLNMYAKMYYIHFLVIWKPRIENSVMLYWIDGPVRWSAMSKREIQFIHTMCNLCYLGWCCYLCIQLISWVVNYKRRQRFNMAKRRRIILHPKIHV